MQLRPGVTGEVEWTVGPADTALALGSGDVPVLGTPKVLALAEAASVAALAGALDAGATTVGTAVALRHLAATAVGAAVRAGAELTAVDGRRLVFAVTVYEVGVAGADRLVADGTVERALVQRERFLSRIGGEPAGGVA